MNSTMAGSWRDQLAALDAEGRAEDALDVLRRAAFERPDDADLGFMVGERLKKSGHLRDAAVVFALVSSLDNEHMRFRALLERAECLRLTGDYSGASADISRAMLIDPGSHWPVVAMAEVYSSAGRDGERLEFIERHYDALRPDGKAELARYASGMQAYWHFEATRRQSWWTPRSPGKIPALERAGFVMMIKDEGDIIAQNLEHHYSIGFRFFCLLDNGSTDSTRDKISNFDKNHSDAVVLYVYDPVVGYYQAQKMDIFQEALLRYATLVGVDLDWIFFIDADEFISYCGPTDSVGVGSLQDILTDQMNEVTVFHWVNAASNQIINELSDGFDVFSALNKVNSKMLPVVPKVGLRAGLDMKPMMGNHFIEKFSGVLNSVRSAALSDWYIIHFPLRSEKHVKMKIINGGRAFLKANNLEDHGGHWRERYALYLKHGDVIIKQILQNHIDSISLIDENINSNNSSIIASAIVVKNGNGKEILSYSDSNQHLLEIRENLNDWEAQIAEARNHAERTENKVEAVRRLAWLQAAGGLLDEAEATLLASAEMFGDRGNAFYSIAALRLAQGDPAGMLMFFDRALSNCDVSEKKRAEIEDLKKSFDGNRFFMPFILDSVGVDPFSHDFLCFVGPQKVSAAERPTYARFMEHALPVIGLISGAAINILERDHALNGASYWYHLHLGHHHWLNGDRAKTDFHYGCARLESLSHKIMPTHFNAGVLTWLDSRSVDALAVEAAVDFVGVDGWHWCAPSDELAPPQLTIVVGCDSGYFAYFPKLLLSLIKTVMHSAVKNVTLLHIHFAEPDRAQLEFLEKWSKHLNHAGSNLHLSYAFGSLKYAEPGIFTCLRFLALPELFSRYNADTIIIDIDDIISADFFEKVDGLRAADLALRMHNFDESQRQIAGEPWSINASQMYVAANEIGKLYSKILKNFISVAYDPSLPTNWTIDQNAVGQAFDYCRKKYSKINVINLVEYGSITVMPHNIGGKEALFNFHGVVNIYNFEEFLKDVS